MMHARFRRLVLVSLLMLILSAGPMGAHSHQSGSSKSCALCQVSHHLKGATSQISGVSRPVEWRLDVLPRPADSFEEAFSSVRRSRGPPAGPTSA